MNASSQMLNRRRLHLHCARSMACASPVPSRGINLTLYTERSLLFATRDDLVCLHAAPDPQYLCYLNQLGIGPRSSDIMVCPDLPDTAELPLPVKLAGDERLWRQLVERLGSVDEVLLQPYMATRFESDFARRLQGCLSGTVQLIGGDSAVIEHIDQKHRAREAALELGIPVAPGEVVEVAAAADWFGLGSAIRRQLSHTGKVIVRGSSGNNGSSLQVVRGTHEVTACIERLLTEQNTIFLIDAMVEVTSSPNIGFFVDPRTRDVSCFSCTEQVLAKGLAHAGNQYPVKDRGQLPAMVAAAERFACYLGDRGVTGHLGFDFCEYKSHAGESAFLLAEINPRINGATYSQTLFAALNRAQGIEGGPSLGAFYAVKMGTSLRSFAALENVLGELLFRPGQAQGVVPVRLGDLTEGKCSIVMVATGAEGLDELHDRVSAKLQPAVMRQAA